MAIWIDDDGDSGNGSDGTRIRHCLFRYEIVFITLRELEWGARARSHSRVPEP